MPNLIRILLAATLVTAPARAASPVVFIHGIKGAELRAPDGALAWLNAQEALGFSTPDLSLPTRFDADGEQPHGPLVATAVLAEIPLIPFLYAAPVYGPFLAQAKAGSRAFKPFFYDWRRDNEETLKNFERFVAAAAAASDTGKVSVVAHSMGGLLTLALINKRPELFDAATFAGVPFKGGLGFLSDLHAGEATGLNAKICGPEVLATFPAVFSLFPLANESLLGTDLKPVPFDFFRASDWKRLKLGPYAPGRTPPIGYDAFLSGALARQRTFRERLAARPGLNYPPVLVINSKAHPTLKKVVLGGPQAIDGVDFESAPKADGDGRVAYETSLPPDGIKYEEFSTEAEHSGLLNDPQAAARALAWPNKP